MQEKLKNTGIEIGLYTLGDLCSDPYTGQTICAHQRIKEIIEAAKLADEAGLDLFGVGEHHRLDYATSSIPVVLAAIAQTTKRIKLTSATTVLSTVDPVRLFEDFATLDLVSDGRAEMIAGRGAFIESFPLFGFRIDDNDALFSEHMELFLKLNEQERVSWQGRFRPALTNAEIAPRPLQKELPIWVGVGGTLESAERAGRFGVGMAMAILGGDPERFKPLADVYRKAGAKAGHAPEKLKIGVTGHGYISKTTQQAKEEFYPYYANYWSYVNRQRGMGGSVSREDFEQMTAPDTALFVGSPQQIVEKILRQHELFGHQRFLAQIDIGGLPFQKVAEGIELLATQVMPIVKKETSK
ncbi:LLM class flavin-dependent oxidoreductase [Domibacillus sp. DTU_2020_1001157_1_SI_ALB_TIR_016]|uniref:LLM class flavin-dependent oxidoreductase n=1 Tax=Domibacillus sp. DTU_2020_1001157_1_SI_ALB_TIR_016 TaxID=3077789 RepID=UPI0028E58D92|nr:LLM class flavin-dependent oxidoreductase [Domibacillus sp. DTU_2020_1001157_1_SI_ALB_TIR_016]WNS78973.1 LLM class flavin-dependent oxidoreductase [Domibacillus sp. DTU_2020_1001157_1_SI_ALB_TIR_016]